MTIDPKLLGELLDSPQSFDFFQAVALLEQLRPERDPVGGFGDPGDEVVRFTVPTSVSFPPSEIAALEDSKYDEPAQMTVSFLGLTGPQGMMPLEYSLYIARRVRAGDRALRDFMGLFNHRMISLFYRGWTKSHAAVRFQGASTAAAEERVESQSPRDSLTTQLLAVVGLDAPGLADRLAIADESLLYYAGLFSMQCRSAAALEQLVSDYFDVPCQVEQFVGAWYPLQQSAQTALGDDGAFLGGGAVAGDEVWDQQGRVRVRIGPLTRRRYDEFLPGGELHEALRALTRFFANDQLDFEIQLVLARDEAPPCRLDADTDPLPLGWCTWLRTTPLERDPDDALFAL
jgi:type VI secretion system protein ImpH